MDYKLAMLFSFSIVIPGVLALALFTKIDKRYYPFIFCVFLGCMNEGLSYYLITHRIFSTVNNNIYVFAEALLLMLYFKKAGVFEEKHTFTIVVWAIVLAWVLEMLVFKTVNQQGIYIRIFFSLLICFCSISLINKILFSYQPRLLTNPDFFLCLCFIVYFSYKAIIQSFIIYGLTRDAPFQKKIYDILIYINLGVNLLYALAVVWMSRKKKSLVQLM